MKIKGWHHLMRWGCLLGALNNSQAMMVNDLYEATLSQEVVAQHQQHEAAEGLKQVFMKVAGGEAVLTSPVLKKALENPRPFLKQYATHPEGVHFVFNRNEVDRILKQAGIAVWGNNRPAVLLWMVIESEAGRTLVGSENNEALANALQQLSKAKGVPFLLPLLDLEDVTTVTVTDVWGGFTETLLKASQRYGTDTLLIGRLSQKNDADWEAQWQLNIGKKHWQWENQATDLSALMTAGAATGIPHLASYYAVAGEEEGQEVLRVEIKGIEQLKAFGRVQQYLQALDPVKLVTVHQIMPDSLIFNIYPYGQNGLTAVQQAITLDPQLTRLVSIQQAVAEDGVDLKVKWIPE